MSRIDTTPREVTDADLIANLSTLVMRARHVTCAEGITHTGEVAIYKTEHGFAVQLRKRDGSAIEFGRHATLRLALEAAVGGGQGENPR